MSLLSPSSLTTWIDLTDDQLKEGSTDAVALLTAQPDWIRAASRSVRTARSRGMRISLYLVRIEPFGRTKTRHSRTAREQARETNNCRAPRQEDPRPAAWATCATPWQVAREADAGRERGPGSRRARSVALHSRPSVCAQLRSRAVGCAAPDP